MADERKSKKIYCNTCKGETRHYLYGSVSYRHGDREEWDYVEGEYRLWACAGCDTGTLEDSYTMPGMLDDEGEAIYESAFHPRRALSDVPSKYFLKLPLKLRGLYQEIVSAYNGNLRVLCASGLRSLVEGICADKGIREKTIEDKIEGLRKLLPDSIVDNLHGFRFMGNRAVHELEAPKRESLRIAIGVVEDLLTFLYELDYKASLLGQKTRPAEVKPQAQPAVEAQPAKKVEPPVQ